MRLVVDGPAGRVPGWSCCVRVERSGSPCGRACGNVRSSKCDLPVLRRNAACSWLRVLNGKSC
eukprot:8767956-Pyramimonas_sp.AAC.1